MINFLFQFPFFLSAFVIGMIKPKNSYESLVVGFVVVGKADKDRVSECSFARKISTRYGAPFCLCSLGSGVCPHNGKRAKFQHHFDGFHVISLCDKLDGFPDLER